MGDKKYKIFNSITGKEISGRFTLTQALDAIERSSVYKVKLADPKQNNL